MDASSAHTVDARRDPGIDPRFLGEVVDGLFQTNARVVASLLLLLLLLLLPRLIESRFAGRRRRGGGGGSGAEETENPRGSRVSTEEIERG